MTTPTFHYRWHWGLHSDPASLWPYVSDTDHFRAVTGFPMVRFTEEPLSTGGSRRIGRLRMYGFPIEWEEEPSEWIVNREIHEGQRYQVGPIGSLKAQLTFEERLASEGGGTRITYDIWATPGNILGYPGIPIQIGIMFRQRFGKAMRRIDDFVQSKVPLPFQTRITPISPAGQSRLREIALQMSQAGHDPTLVSRTIEFVRNAPDDQLTRIRPFVLADRWGVDRYGLLEVFLRATRLGLFDLSWDLLCPSCRGAKVQTQHLHDVSAHAHCPSCNIDYEVDFDHAVEATFHVNPAIKAVKRADYCLGSPQNTPHLLIQQVLKSGEQRTLNVALDLGAYRWVAPSVAQTAADDPIASPSLKEWANGQAMLAIRRAVADRNYTLTINADGQSIQSSTDLLGVGDVQISLVNNSPAPQIVFLAQTEWSDQACTAAEITSLQAFRDLFSSEALRPGESITVENLTILFTDLKGSTALYQSIGDASAFRQVMDHFAILRDGVTRHHGGLVKTIGDAIMAVFTDPADAVAAALDIQHGIRDYNATQTGQPLVLKLGIHQGTCIAVTLNERLDYFGTVVNIAARLEGQSHGGDIVVSESVASDPGVNALINNRHVQVLPFKATLKGFADSFNLARLSLPKEAAPPAMSVPSAVLAHN